MKMKLVMKVGKEMVTVHNVDEFICLEDDKTETCEACSIDYTKLP